MEKNLMHLGQTTSWTAPAKRQRQRRFRADLHRSFFLTPSPKRCRAALATAVQDVFFVGDDVRSLIIPAEKLEPPHVGCCRVGIFA